jgi:hypothetical protein
MVTDMNKKLIVIVFLLWSSAYCAFGQANQWGPFDPGALRNDGSNASSAATVRDNLGLGTMAVATSTDYVATDTFTGHTGATGASVHGLGTISTKAATDYVATSALALRLDTTNASISNNLDVAGNVGAATLNGVTPLTAAEKTQALVGSSTVDFAAAAIDAEGFSTFGELGTGLKMKIIASSTASTEGANTFVLHGLTSSKIVSVAPLVATGSIFIPPHLSEAAPELQYSFWIRANDIAIANSNSNSGSILSAPVSIVIWYKE